MSADAVIPLGAGCELSLEFAPDAWDRLGAAGRETNERLRLAELEKDRSIGRRAPAPADPQADLLAFDDE